MQDKGSTWAPLDIIWFPIREITICEANTQNIYYSTWSDYNQSSEVRRTTDGGLTWSHIDYSDISGIRSIAPINALYVHPPKKFGQYLAVFNRMIRYFTRKTVGIIGVTLLVQDYLTFRFSALNMIF
jgi:hypothetical protein